MHMSKTVAEAIWSLGFDDAAPLSQLELRDGPALFPSVFRVNTAASACIGAAELAAAEVRVARGGKRQTVTVESERAEMSYRSEHYLTVNGEAPEGPNPRDYYQDRSGRWIQLHRVYPHHRAAMADYFGLPADDREGLAGLIATRDAVDIETELAGLGLPGYAYRTEAEWQQHPQAEAIAALPLLELEAIGDAPPLSLSPPAERILDGVRVLDLTRVIAGPVCGRTLAAHGAEVLRVHAPALTENLSLLLDAGRGKRSTALDLTSTEGRAQFEALLADAHVIVQGFRPGGLEALGYGSEELARRYPGLAQVSLSAWSHAGPWAGRHGFDSLVQTASGIAAHGAAALGSDMPKPLPCQALDHSSGYLAAFSVCAALARRIREGGTWRTRLSLAQTGRWFTGLGRVDNMQLSGPSREQIAAQMMPMDSAFGPLSVYRVVADFAESPVYWHTGPVPLDHDAPVWT